MADQKDLLSELQLLQLGHILQQQAQKKGRYDGPAAEALIGIADALEVHHGWDPLLVDAWLERLGLWDVED